jgi:hypothetical protein
MKVTYDWRTDTLAVILRDQTQVAESYGRARRNGSARAWNASGSSSWGV